MANKDVTITATRSFRSMTINDLVDALGINLVKNSERDETLLQRGPFDLELNVRTRLFYYCRKRDYLGWTKSRPTRRQYR